MINDVPGAAREGLHAMAAGADGKLFAVWLDLRENGMRLFGAQSRNAGLTWSKNVQVYQSPSGTICQCCHPSLSIDETGRVWVMWRNVLDGSRDLHLASSSDGIHFEAPRKLGEGTWKIDACPMDGGGFVVHGSRVTAAWRREGEIFLNEPGKPERAIGPGKDVAIAAGKAGIFVAWTKDGAIQTMTPRAAEPQLLSPDGAFVNLTTLEDGTVLAAWEARGSIETKHLN
ncbi:MAG: exo-alpha-sialidase [Pirellulaceae bacterium]|nr:exo-alpha-sialidase [Pirellulaceae bacterium]